MDLVLLGMKLKDDPQTYRKEYTEELRSFESLIALPNPPLAQIKPMLTFIIQNCHVDPERSVGLLFAALGAVKDMKTKRTILGGFILIRQKSLMDSQTLFTHVITHGSDLTFYLRGCQEFLGLECYGVLVEWYRKGTERQRSFCYYFLLILHSRLGDAGLEKDAGRCEELEGIICEAFFGASKISKICMLYFLNRTEVTFDISGIARGAEYARRIHKELQGSHFDRDVKIMKLRIFVIFKKFFQVRCSIVNTILKMVDLEKEDLGALLDCLVGSVERGEARNVLEVINEEFFNESRDDDVICYGMNVMRELYYRLAGLEKGAVLSLDEECLEDDVSEEMVDAADPFVSQLREMILQYIEPFKGNRTRSIHYAYKALIKAVVRNETIDKPTTFVLKSKTKEEREELRKKNTVERKREEAQEKREKKQKRNRKGRLRNKKNSLLLPARKKAKRS